MLIIKRQVLKWQRGDTLIEVLIVLAILGLALSISYATANRSLLQAREAQENAYAANLAEAQFEKLRSMSKHQFDASKIPVDDEFIYQNGGVFTQYCIDQNVNKMISATGSPIDPGCKIKDLYEIRISFTPATGQTFKVNVSWPNVQGEGTDNVTMSYRLHQ